MNYTVNTCALLAFTDCILDVVIRSICDISFFVHEKVIKAKE